MLAAGCPGDIARLLLTTLPDQQHLDEMLWMVHSLTQPTSSQPVQCPYVRAMFLECPQITDTRQLGSMETVQFAGSGDSCARCLLPACSILAFDGGRLRTSLACIHPGHLCRPRVRGRFISAPARSASDPPPQGAEASSSVLTAAVREVLLPRATPQ